MVVFIMEMNIVGSHSLYENLAKKMSKNKPRKSNKNKLVKHK